MLRALVVVGLIVGLVAALVFGPRMLRTSANGEQDVRQLSGAVRCDLMAGPCHWPDGAGQWQAELAEVTETGGV